MPQQRVGGAYRRHFFLVQRVHDGRGHAVPCRHCHEYTVHPVSVRQAKGDVGQATRRVGAQLLTDFRNDLERLLAVGQDRIRRGRAQRHDQGVNHDVVGFDAKIRSAFNNLLRHGKAHFGIRRNTGFIITNGHHRTVVLRGQWQHDIQRLILTGD